MVTLCEQVFDVRVTESEKSPIPVHLCKGHAPAMGDAAEDSDLAPI